MIEMTRIALLERAHCNYLRYRRITEISLSRRFEAAWGYEDRRKGILEAVDAGDPDLLIKLIRPSDAELDDFKIKELKVIGRNIGVKYFSKMNKEQLVEAIKDERSK